jgi:hypothetical protein
VKEAPDIRYRLEKGNETEAQSQSFRDQPRDSRSLAQLGRIKPDPGVAPAARPSTKALGGLRALSCRAANQAAEEPLAGGRFEPHNEPGKLSVVDAISSVLNPISVGMMLLTPRGSSFGKDKYAILA